MTLFNPETNEVCDLPNTPSIMGAHTLDLIDGTLISCGSYDGGPGNVSMKYDSHSLSISFKNLL